MSKFKEAITNDKKMTKRSTSVLDNKNKSKETEQELKQRQIYIACGNLHLLKRRLESPVPDSNNLDCLLLADTSNDCASIHLCTLSLHYDCTQLTQGELLFLLLYAVALESGYVCEENYEVSKHFISQLSSITTFHSKNVIRLSRLKPIYKVSTDKMRFSMRLISIIDFEPLIIEQLFSLLSASVTGDLLIVTLSPANSMDAEGFSVALSIGRYILTTQTPNKPIYYRFKKLDELSMLLRNKLFVPMRNTHLQWLQVNIYPSLDALPAELYDNILQYLNKNELNCLANVNRSLHNLVTQSKYMELRKQQQHDEQLRKIQIEDNSPLSRSNSALYYLR